MLEEQGARESAAGAAVAVDDSSHTALTQAESDKTADIGMEMGDLSVGGLTDSHSQSFPAHKDHDEQRRAGPAGPTPSTRFGLTPEQQLHCAPPPCLPSLFHPLQLIKLSLPLLSHPPRRVPALSTSQCLKRPR